MRRFNIAYSIGCIALVALSLQSCERSGGLDNLNVITKPYSLHFSDTAGLVYSTNDGVRFKTLSGTDDIPVQALATSGSNILMVKKFGTNLFVSDGGQGKNVNFNRTYTKINPAAFGTSLMINLPGYNDTGKGGKKDRLYVASEDGSGIVYQDYNGHKDSSWFQVGDIQLNAKVTSFARQSGGGVVAYDNTSRAIWVKPDLATPWTKKQGGGIPGTGKSYIITQNNDILVVVVEDIATNTGIWRSADGGDNFSMLPALPGGAEHITCAAAPFGKVIIACTRNYGIFRLSGQGVWESANVGLDNGTRIYAISFHNNVFKNEKAGEYVFIGTSTGLYRSDDLGQTWIKLEVPSIEHKFTEVH